MLSVPDLEGKVKSGEIDTVIVGMADRYGRMVGRGMMQGSFWNPLRRRARTPAPTCWRQTWTRDSAGIQGCRLGDSFWGRPPAARSSSRSALWTCGWLEKTALVLCDIQTESHELAGHAPRSTLQRQVAEAKKLICQPMAATEVEYYLYQDSFEVAYKKRYAGLSAVGWHREDYHIASSAGHTGTSSSGPSATTATSFEWLSGGWMKYSLELMVFYAPNVNSYKRFHSGL
ncbi:glutamine synthetase [Klebsormidium nitens]|uniref:Glutamine synthetase n=1 Tax=Klebsormidium nitens TaxID=105231 RepID=A0A1Y1HUI9_KLENI|nr:glutamine synthetase [Klebsormidium nitens]|eukprot:GAQ80196.1 glutamine synthetase [Klebsormidium nitens]